MTKPRVPILCFIDGIAIAIVEGLEPLDRNRVSVTVHRHRKPIEEADLAEQDLPRRFPAIEEAHASVPGDSGDAMVAKMNRRKEFEGGSGEGHALDLAADPKRDA